MNITEIENNIFGIVNSIVDSSVSDDKKIRQLKKKDFIEKFNLFKDAIKRNKKTSKREKFDVVIFTIVPIEFEYANKLLQFMGIDDYADFFDDSGLGYHTFEFDRSGLSKPNLNCVITLVGTAGDVNCALTCSQFFSKYDCDLAILCGIAAGVEGEVPIYSTVAAKNIINYEFQRLEMDGIQYRPIPYVQTVERKNEINEVIKKKELLKSLIINNINKYNTNDKLKLEEDKISSIDFKSGVIGSGAKLLADTKTIQTLRENIPIEKGIIAVEMEGSGFVPACEMYKRNWMVFRGISDYGQNDKDNPNNKAFQKFAVISAVTTMKYYLENIYRNDRNISTEDLDF